MRVRRGQPLHPGRDGRALVPALSAPAQPRQHRRPAGIPRVDRRLSPQQFQGTADFVVHDRRERPVLAEALGSAVLPTPVPYERRVFALSSEPRNTSAAARTVNAFPAVSRTTEGTAFSLATDNRVASRTAPQMSPQVVISNVGKDGYSSGVSSGARTVLALGGQCTGAIGEQTWQLIRKHGGRGRGVDRQPGGSGQQRVTFRIQWRAGPATVATPRAPEDDDPMPPRPVFQGRVAFRPVQSGAAGLVPSLSRGDAGIGERFGHSCAVPAPLGVVHGWLPVGAVGVIDDPCAGPERGHGMRAMCRTRSALTPW
jgi:hypothetical protein